MPIQKIQEEFTFFADRKLTIVVARIAIGGILINKPLHSFLFAALPLLYMLYVNLEQISSLAAVRIVGCTVLGVALIYGLAWILLRNSIRAGLVASLCVLVWYTWYHSAALTLIFPLAMLAVIDWGLKGRVEEIAVIFLNVISLFMAIFIVIMISLTGIRRDLHIGSTHASVPASHGPDVYFIVVDSLGSPKLLQERFGYNSQPFVVQLQQSGFQVGECRSTATETRDSLTAMLNGNPQLPYGYNRLVHPALRTTLESQGYSTWAFSTGWIWTEFMDADRYYQPAYGPMTEFEAFALTLTPLWSLIDLNVARGNMSRLRTLTLLEHLPDAAADPKAQFVFAHILPPHPPFVFGPNGETLDPVAFENSAWNFGDASNQEYLPELYDKGYVKQLQYMVKAIPPVLEKIIAASPNSIIILTGDHGPWYGKNDYENHAVLCATRGLKALDALDAVNEIIKK